ncbi:MAG: AraC family transcriptional regulator [Eubacteriales bacterium]|nr:AraC family transcriptional regulator [Eubacteriales bacterium]
MEDYWTETERFGFQKVQQNGKITYTLSGDKGVGTYELWGDPNTAVAIYMDYTLNTPWTVLASTKERYLQVSQFYSGSVDIYRKKRELNPSELGLNCYLNYPGDYGYKRVNPRVRIVDMGLFYRENFFEKLPFSLPEDFWESAARVLNPSALVIPAVTNALDQLFTCRLTGHELELYVHGKAYEVFALLFEYIYKNIQAPPVHLSSTDRMALEQVKVILANHLMDPPKITQLAAMVGVNQQKLMTGFRYLNGMTVYHYLKRLRMQKAVELLRDTNLSVLEIAQAVGYYGDGHFQSAFRAAYGISPSKMRRDLSK